MPNSSNQIQIGYYMQGEASSFQVVLPTLIILPGLIEKGSTAQPQFLVGYRNILSCKSETVSWGIVKSKLHCGRAFVYPIEEQKALAIQKFKTEDEIIQSVGNTYVFLKIEKNVAKPTANLSTEVLQKLLNELGGVNKINLNILKNAFDSYDQYRSVVSIESEQGLGIQDGIKELQPIEKLEVQKISKKLSGNALMQLPLISKETGKWEEQKTVALRLIEH